jgi:hypothetical protein
MSQSRPGRAEHIGGVRMERLPSPTKPTTDDRFLPSSGHTEGGFGRSQFDPERTRKRLTKVNLNSDVHSEEIVGLRHQWRYDLLGYVTHSS